MTTLNEARELGLSRYFTGRKCVRGHIAERMTANRTCVTCNDADVLARNNARYGVDPSFTDDQKARSYNTRARKFGCEGILTGADLRAVRGKQNSLCTCGKRKIDVFDHIVALWKQGPNYLFNLRGLCQPCDDVKFSSDHREWHATIGLRR